MGFSGNLTKELQGTSGQIEIDVPGQALFLSVSVFPVDANGDEISATGGTADLMAITIGRDEYETVYQSDGTTPESFDMTNPETVKIEGYSIRKMRTQFSGLAGANGVKMIVSYGG